MSRFVGNQGEIFTKIIAQTTIRQGVALSQSVRARVASPLAVGAAAWPGVGTPVSIPQALL